ncbi:MAG: sulfotransferase, partial [archaeon]|nr:sulfotransferase [archaeon]
YVKSLLAYHPKVRTGRESFLFAWYLGPMIQNWNRPTGKAGGYAGLRAYLTNDEFHEVLYETSDRLLGFMAPNMQADDIFVEKTPNHVYWIPEILEVYPNARFIHVLRDARDVTASMLAASKTFGKNWAPRFAFVAARRWTKHVSAARQAKKKLPMDQFYEIRYENLRSNPAKELRSLVDFLKLEWSERELLEAIEKNDPKNRSIRGSEIRGEYAKVYGSTVERRQGAVRKARPGSWKQDLKFYEKWQVWIFARSKMKEVGYPWQYPW